MAETLPNLPAVAKLVDEARVMLQLAIPSNDEMAELHDSADQGSARRLAADYDEAGVVAQLVGHLEAIVSTAYEAGVKVTPEGFVSEVVLARTAGASAAAATATIALAVREFLVQLAGRVENGLDAVAARDLRAHLLHTANEWMETRQAAVLSYPEIVAR